MTTSTLKKRWSEYKIDQHERPKIIYEYFVTGRGAFPFDMLRYDSCWPASSEDAAKLDMQFANAEHAYRQHRSIRMRSYREPTVERWSSFNWSAGTERL
jgi:hypothetical protein